MKLRWDPRALQALREIRGYNCSSQLAYYCQPRPSASAKRVRLLPANPKMGVASSNREIRILAPTRYPYRIYYTVQNDDIVILHIRHTARQSPDDLGL
jgi:toxin ParE1/3/4